MKKNYLVEFNISLKNALYTPNANMADHSVAARDELYESEASEASVFCFDNASPEKSCIVVNLFLFISLCLRVCCVLNATRRERKILHHSPVRENSGFV